MYVNRIHNDIFLYIHISYIPSYRWYRNTQVEQWLEDWDIWKYVNEMLNSYTQWKEKVNFHYKWKSKKANNW